MDHPAEGARIEAKTDRALTLAQFDFAGFGQGMKVLDIGCAAGTITRMLAERVGEGGQACGIDASAARLEQARAYPQQCPNIEYRQGDALRLPAADGEFDAAWSRFVMEYLADPLDAMREMRRVVRPGGTLLVSDLDGNCVWHHPINAAFEADLRDALATLGAGFDPHVGRKLWTLAHDAGWRDLAIDVRPYHIIAGAIDATRESHWCMKLEGVAHALRLRGWTESRTRGLCDRFMAHLRDERTFTCSTLITVRGRA